MAASPAPTPRLDDDAPLETAAGASWIALRAGHERLLAASDDHLRLCAASMPDTAGLARARWRVAQAGRARMTLLVGSILPSLDARCGSDDRAALDRFADATVAYRRSISDYVKRWPIETIVADWTGYRRAAERFRADIVARIALETALLQPMLERLDVGPST